MIILAATPLGNDGDASQRLRDALENADIIAAEDTRRLLNLAGRLQVKLHAPVIPYHDHNEQEKANDLIELAKSGKDVLVVSDAGMPLISDPGYRLVADASAAGVSLTLLPGPSAVLSALALSGLATDKFTFEGFVARKAGARQKDFSALADEHRTMIFFESPRRLVETLQDMVMVFGAERKVAVCRELTKLHEQVQRGTLAELVTWAQQDIRGEIVIVLAGLVSGQEIQRSQVQEVVHLSELGLRLKDAANHVAKRDGISKNELYKLALENKATS